MTEKTIQRLVQLKDELYQPFPQKDIEQIQIDYRTEFSKLRLEDNMFKADLSEYCAMIVGTLSYVLADKTDDLPHTQIKLLEHSFFDMYSQYKFLESKTKRYAKFYLQYQVYEEARLLLMQLLK